MALGRALVLVFNFASAFGLFMVCLAYFSMLNHPAVLSSLLDWRGGLWELPELVPALWLANAASGWLTTRIQSQRKTASWFLLAASVSAVGCFVLAHFIRTAL